jgi:hypothetical protein
MVPARGLSLKGCSVKLFDDFTRADSTPARSQEGSFVFLNRIATPWWSEVRLLLETWFHEYCRDASAEKAADLRARFRSRDDRQHLGAWWELYVHQLLGALHPGRSVRVEPERPGQAKRPDFCVAAGPDSPPELWVEAVTTFSGISEAGRHGAREAYVLDTINELQSPDFRLMITFRAVGKAHPRKREILEPLRQWLSTLDRADLLSRERRNGRTWSQTILRPDGWEIVLEAIPKGTPGTHPRDRLIGVGPVSAGFVDDVSQARKAILGKIGRYRGLEAPLVLAVMPISPTFGVQDAVEVLYGSEAIEFDPKRLDEPGRLIRRRDGVWSDPDDRVSAVVFGSSIFPWMVGKVWPHVSVNPGAVPSPISELVPLPRVEISEGGQLESLDPEGPPASLFGLPQDWPGSGDPFDVEATATGRDL